MPKSEWPPHDPRRRKSLDQRIVERKDFHDGYTVKVPAHWASNDVRRARLRYIREDRLGMSRIEFAAALGVAPTYYDMLENGRKKCAMTYLMLAEIIHRAAYRKERYHERKAEEQIAELTHEAKKAAMIRAKAISMHVMGTPHDEIAGILSVDAQMVTRWTSGI